MLLEVASHPIAGWQPGLVVVWRVEVLDALTIRSTFNDVFKLY